MESIFFTKQKQSLPDVLVNGCSRKNWNWNWLKNTCKAVVFDKNSFTKRVLLCVKSVRIRSYSGPYFLAFWLNTERYRVSLYIHSDCREIRTGIALNTDTSHAVTMPSQKILLWRSYYEFSQFFSENQFFETLLSDYFEWDRIFYVPTRRGHISESTTVKPPNSIFLRPVDARYSEISLYISIWTITWL